MSGDQRLSNGAEGLVSPASSVSETPGRLIVIAAPSGAGKTSLVKGLLEDETLGLRLSVSTTTRAPRPGETHGESYFFVTREAFEAQREAGAFLEWAEVHGNLYGTSAATVGAALTAGHQLLLEIDWQGARQVRALFPPDQRLTIFILPPSVEELRRRLEQRGQDSQDIIDQRIAAAEDEMSHAAEFDHVIMNQDFSLALAALKQLIRQS